MGREEKSNSIQVRMGPKGLDFLCGAQCFHGPDLTTAPAPSAMSCSSQMPPRLCRQGWRRKWHRGRLLQKGLQQGNLAKVERLHEAESSGRTLGAGATSAS